MSLPPLKILSVKKEFIKKPLPQLKVLKTPLKQLPPLKLPVKIQKISEKKREQLKLMNEDPWSIFDDVLWVMNRNPDTVRIYDEETEEFISLSKDDPLVDKYNSINLGSYPRFKLSLGDLYVFKTIYRKKTTPKQVIDFLYKFYWTPLPNTITYDFYDPEEKVVENKYVGRLPINLIEDRLFAGFEKEGNSYLIETETTEGIF